MFQLHDLRKSRVWQEAHKEGKTEGKVEGKAEGRTEAQQALVHRLVAKGKPLKEIAELLDMPMSQVRRLASR